MLLYKLYFKFYNLIGEDNMANEKTDLRILKTKKNIYSTFEELMKCHAFEEIKVSDICNNAMINRSTFYAHYDDKFELLAEYINTLKDMLSNELSKNENIKNSKEYYLKMIEIVLDHIENKKATYTSIMVNNKNSITMDIFYDVISKDISMQMDKMNENKKVKVPASIVSKFYLGAVISVCTEWISTNKYSKEEIISYFNILIPDNVYD